jgi:hypothetical protein
MAILNEGSNPFFFAVSHYNWSDTAKLEKATAVSNEAGSAANIPASFLPSYGA